MSDFGSGHRGGEEHAGVDNDSMDDRELDRAFDLLGDERRRYVLQKLQATSDEMVSAEALADRPSADMLLDGTVIESASRNVDP